MDRPIFFTADTHFSHRLLARIRGFSSVEEMDEALIEAWNSRVPRTALVWHLGDFHFGPNDSVVRTIERLNGSIVLVRGNHDRLSTWIEAKFGSVHDYRKIKTDGRKIILFHYPISVWDGAHHGTWHLHGHSHGNLADIGVPRLDVGVDTNPDLTPWSWWEIQERMQGRTYVPLDDHGRENRDDA